MFKNFLKVSEPLELITLETQNNHSYIMPEAIPW